MFKDLQQFNFASNKTISVTAGWNIIGWNSTDSSEYGTITDDGLIIANTLHEYNIAGKHQFKLQTNSTLIKANRGYWVKCNDSGTI